MTTTFAVIVQWSHIAAAIMWAGGVALGEIVLRPALRRLPLEVQRTVGRTLTPPMSSYFAIAGTLTIVFGVLRGTRFGPLHGWHAFLTPFGITWSIALLIASALAVIGGLGVGKTSRRLYLADEDGHEGARQSDERDHRLLAVYGYLQLVGFLVVLACMVLMSEVFS